jgi:hypothetical protein
MSVDPATTQQLHDTKNHHLQHPDEDQSTHGTSSTDSREATKTVDQEVSERLANDPDYQRVDQELKDALGLQKDWLLVEGNSPMANDGKLTLADISVVASDPLRPQNVRDAANRLLANPTFLTAVNKDDTLASAQDVAAYVQGLRTEMKAQKDAVTAEVKQERGVQANPQAGAAADSATPNGAPAPAATGSTPAQSVPLPPPSDKPGMEGAMENLGNMGDYYSKQMLAIANDSSIDPGKKSALIADLQTKQQATMNMLNQLIQMMQNTSKLWSDIAMNSVRNIK